MCVCHKPIIQEMSSIVPKRALPLSILPVERNTPSVVLSDRAFQCGNWNTDRVLSIESLSGLRPTARGKHPKLAHGSYSNTEDISSGVDLILDQSVMDRPRKIPSVV